MLGLIGLIIANQSSYSGKSPCRRDICVAPLLFSLAPQWPQFFHSRIAAVTPASHPLTRLNHISRSWQFIVRLKFFSKWELSIGLSFKSNVLYKSIASKTFSPLWITFQQILSKWCFLNGVAQTFPTHKSMGVGRWAGIWKFQQKMLFS